YGTKEVAERMVAAPKSKGFGILTLMVKYFSEANIEIVVPNSSFIPEPGVTSAVISLEKKRNYDVKNEKVFFELIHKAFAQRRKKMTNSLVATKFNNMSKEEIEGLFTGCNLSTNTRAEELEIEDFINIVNNI
ncbi:MAG: 16S rRNA (adenine(1518)-N(6)/adenine(1519)-N(6))-dimethyltransferase, partial [Clostridia bacterium]|nr:16S rRNA (adenine(1518)-N(6)/adenine(1519)-N(6))-dimethyltransferase [Clostridia bacterium]